ncbi:MULTISPECIES: hypothetical protein [Rhodococcus]|uniref:Membrane protein n=1 Tax=Rhodococcus opacus TaxID=37919 RepID=A0A076EVF7_RHOOP|nr:hypothetical protein [Rhodococcus opacus]AII10055.1 membrane protein [Rhodococcus opacus]
MLVVTLALAAVGFALLVVALMTGSVVWAWGCIVVCVAGAVLLLVSALAGKKAAAVPGQPASGVPGERGPARDTDTTPGSDEGD